MDRKNDDSNNELSKHGFSQIEAWYAFEEDECEVCAFFVVLEMKKEIEHFKKLN